MPIRIVAERRIALYADEMELARIAVPETLDRKIETLEEAWQVKNRREERSQRRRGFAKVAAIVILSALALHFVLYYHVEAYRIPVQRFFLRLVQDGDFGVIDFIDGDSQIQDRGEAGDFPETGEAWPSERWYPDPDALFTVDEKGNISYERDPQKLQRIYGAFPYDTAVPAGFRIDFIPSLSAAEGEICWINDDGDAISFAYYQKEHDGAWDQNVFTGQMKIDTENADLDEIVVRGHYALMTTRNLKGRVHHNIVWEEEHCLYCVYSYYAETAKGMREEILKMLQNLKEK